MQADSGLLTLCLFICLDLNELFIKVRVRLKGHEHTDGGELDY